MNQERLMKVLLGPHITEKASIAAETNQQIVFKVATDANKTEIKKAVELLFEVEVNSVQVANVKGKRKRFGAIQGRRSGYKKAYVQLKAGSEIDFTSAAE
ncbi:MAG: 50S ribosomal protein L23 [Gammaproteobacteria bacterium]|nr:50S ribosomal protein L23 [Gammaproteobacteria bacterium]